MGEVLFHTPSNAPVLSELLEVAGLWEEAWHGMCKCLLGVRAAQGNLMDAIFQFCPVPLGVSLEIHGHGIKAAVSSCK